MAMRENKLHVHTQSSGDPASLTVFELVSLDSFSSGNKSTHISNIQNKAEQQLSRT